MRNSVTVPDILVKLCWQFADKVIDTNLDKYASRNQFSKSKIRADIAYGKIGEWGAYLILSEDNPLLSFPDMQVYNSGKTFDSDLHDNVNRYHIKTQTEYSAKTYGNSWLFQKEDPLFKHATINDIVLGLQIDDVYNKVSVKIMSPFKDLKFSAPKLAKLNTKLALYLEDNV